MMISNRFAFLLALAAASAACAPTQEGGASPPGADDVAEDDIKRQLSDSQLMGKLNGILADVIFISESDYPYVVFEGGVVTEPLLTEALVREKLKDAVKANSSSERDISLPECRATSVDIDREIAEGDGTPSGDDDYERHARQLMIALKTMRAQLRSVVGFRFGTTESGDMDELGTVHYVYVGISKTTGRLIAIMTEAVYT